MLKILGIKSKECNNENIKKFFDIFKDLNRFLKENIKLIEQQDIKEFLEKGHEIIDKISNL